MIEKELKESLSPEELKKLKEELEEFKFFGGLLRYALATVKRDKLIEEIKNRR